MATGKKLMLRPVTLTRGFTPKGLFWSEKSGKSDGHVMAKLHKTNSGGFINGQAPGIWNGCQDEKTVVLLLKMLMKTPVV